LTKGLVVATIIQPVDWFRKGHSQGSFIWTAAPARAEVVVGQLLGRARLKIPESIYLVVVPRIMTGSHDDI
jgi:hypothetical protein